MDCSGWELLTQVKDLSILGFSSEGKIEREIDRGIVAVSAVRWALQGCVGEHLTT